MPKRRAARQLLAEVEASLTQARAAEKEATRAIYGRRTYIPECGSGYARLGK